MLFELAVADAYGAAFEFTKPEFIKANNTLAYLRHPSRDHEEIMKGYYTDDTQMSLAVAELMMRAEESNQVVTQVDFATEFVKVFQRNPRKGYSKRVQTALESVKQITVDPCYGEPVTNAGLEFMKYLGSSSSTANGCVMRTLPLGFLTDIDKIKRYCILHTSVTHTSMEAIEATVVAALAAHALYHRKCNNSNLHKWLILNVDLSDSMRKAVYFENRNRSPVPCRAKETISAALYLVKRYNDLASILYNAIDMGGDTDSVAAVAVGLGSVCTNIENNLPLRLKRGLEYGTYGKYYLKELDVKLHKQFPV